MDAEIEIFLQKLPPEKQEILRGFQSPYQVQAYLDSLPYIAEERDRSPLDVMLDGQGHCLDGGLLAAVGLRYLGFTPVIIDLVPEPGKDDDHVLALFQVDGLYGAVAKSNYVGLRYREPVYRSLRELVMSYFEPYFSVEGERSLRGYTRPMDLRKLDRFEWMWSEEGVKEVSKRLYARKWIPLLSPASIERLNPVDERSYAGNTIGTNLDEAFYGKNRVGH
jgi:hypothetical protein